MKIKILKIIFSKILNILLILLGIFYIPLQSIVIKQLDWSFRSIFVIIILSIISIITVIIGLFGLLRTNNPANRFNIFTINYNWKDKMKNSISEDPSQLFKLDSPDVNDIREKKINVLLKNEKERSRIQK